MSKKELHKSYIIHMTIMGHITVAEASDLLKLTTRRIKQLKAKYRELDDEAFIHCNKTKPSSKRLSEHIHSSIVEFRKKTDTKIQTINTFKRLLKKR